jgi:hypothetical protein
VSWPTPQDYNEAIQAPRLNFFDPELKDGVVETTHFGLPRPITGGFASVYRVRCGGREWAVRCFLREFLDQQQRYDAISKHLTSAKLPYTVGFNFLPQGIRVKGQWYPILKMEWVQGELLHRYVKRNLSTPTALLDLANRWVTMMKALQAASIAHGDLQHGNVLVVNGEPRLIDYDGMYVPALAGRGSHEEGHRNYQHPQRTGFDFDLSIDGFAGWVIYISLVAFSIAPELWDKVNAGDECLLFRRADFDAPYSSESLNLLSKHPDPRLDALGSFFQSLLYCSPGGLPSFDGQNLINNLQPSTTQPGRVGGQSNKPEWLNDYLPESPVKASDRPSQPSFEGNATWVLDFVNPPTPLLKSFETDVFRPRIILGAGLIATGMLLLLYVMFAITLGPTVIFMTVTWMIVASFIRDYYQRSPDVIAMREAVKNHLKGEELTRELKAEVKNKEAQKKLVLSREKKERKTLEAQRSSLNEKERREKEQVQFRLNAALNNANSRRQAVNREEAESLRKVQDRTGAEVNQLTREIANITTAEAKELADTLRNLQAQILDGHLRSRSIDYGSIDGVGEKLKFRLRMAGIKTAADVEYWRVKMVDGIGHNKAQALVDWKNRIASFAKVPSALSPANVAAIKAKYVGRKPQLESQLLSAQQRLNAEVGAVKARAADARKVIDTELSAIQNRGAQELQAISTLYAPRYAAVNKSEADVSNDANAKCRDLDEEIRGLRRRLGEQQWQLAKTYRELESYKVVSAKNFARKMLGLSL